MAVSYWNRVLAGRINRRRAIAATGATALVTAFLAACGSDGKSSANKDAAGLLSKAEDTSEKAAPGGVVQIFDVRDPPHVDPHLIGGTADIDKFDDIYDHLLFRLPGLNGKLGNIAGNVAESFELAPDGLTLTMKLRQNMPFDPRPPTNGRAISTQDVVWSWERFRTLSPFGADLDAQANAGAPVRALTAPDDKTLVFKLDYPSRSVLNYFAHKSYFAIMPIEADAKFNAKAEARGSGPFMLDKWTPSVNIQLKKNPNWWWKGRPFVDGMTTTFIAEYSSAMAQFETGALWTFRDKISQEDVLRVKHSHPSLVMTENADLLGGAGSNGAYNVFSQQPTSPMRDVRVRRAASMLIDRDAWIDAYYNTQEFKDAGLSVSINWNSCISAGFDECLRPNFPEEAKKLGEGAKYYQHDVAEAKKLLQAAGYKREPIDEFADNTPDRQKINTILSGFWREEFNINYRVLDYNTEFRDICQRAGGTKHSGFCYTTASGLTAEIYLTSVFLPEGKFAAWRDPKNLPYPDLDAMVRKMRTEIDEQKQLSQIQDIQRWAALNMPHLMNPGSSRGYMLHWPWLENDGLSAFSTYISPGNPIIWWYNKEKDPKAKAS